MRKALLLSVVALLMLVAGGSAAQADPCPEGACSPTIDQQYIVLQSDVAVNVPARFQTPFAGLATLAQRLQPSSPMTPVNVRQFIPSAVAPRALWEGNRPLAGAAGYSCAPAGPHADDVAACDADGGAFAFGNE